MKKEFQSIYDEIAELMGSALDDSAHSYRTFSFASIEEKYPKVRTVVLRDFSKENNYFEFHSDMRSPKIKELKNNNNFSSMFYCSEKKVQIRYSGKVKIFSNCKESEARWTKVSPSSKRCYLGPYSPSESLSEYHPNIPSNVKFKNPSEEEALSGYKNFVIIRCTFDNIDYLKLKYSGHFRCNFKINDKIITANWVAP